MLTQGLLIVLLIKKEANDRHIVTVILQNGKPVSLFRYIKERGKRKMILTATDPSPYSLAFAKYLKESY